MPGLRKPSESPVEPSEAIRNLQPALRGLMSSDVGIDLQIDPQGHLVMVDPAEFDHIITNLVLNARDAMPNGGTVTLTSASRVVQREDALQRGVEPGEYVSLTVSDTGVGIQEDVLPRVFEPFFTTKGRDGWVWDWRRSRAWWAGPADGSMFRARLGRERRFRSPSPHRRTCPLQWLLDEDRELRPHGL